MKDTTLVVLILLTPLFLVLLIIIVSYIEDLIYKIWGED